MGSAIAAFPSSHPIIPDTSCVPYYNTTKVLDAWGMLIGIGDEMEGNDGYAYDLITLGSTVASNRFYAMLQEFQAACVAKDVVQMGEIGASLVEIISDVDSLLQTSPSHLFGKYLQSAETSGTNMQETNMFRAAAKRLVTVWGYPMATGTVAAKSKNSGVSDYAYRLWAGLLSSYYLPRWESWVGAMVHSVNQGWEKFDEAAFEQDLLEWELAWIANSTITSTTIGTTTEGNALQNSAKLYAKWKNPIAPSPAPPPPPKQSWMCYHWDASDLHWIATCQQAPGHKSNAQCQQQDCLHVPARKWSHGQNKPYPGCGTCHCCQPSSNSTYF